MKSTMMDRDLTLVHVLERAGTLFADRQIVTREPDGRTSRTTYGAVYERSRRLAGALAGLGIERGDRVATLGMNHARHLEAYFGVPVAGAVLHTINPRLSIDHIASIVRTADDRAVLVDESLLPVLEALPTDVRPGHVIVWSDERARRDDHLAYEALLDAHRDPLPYPKLSEDEAASMCFTSATTGAPKGVVYSHRALVLHSIVSAMPDEFGISGHDVVMPIVPMFHVNAWGLPYTASLVGAGLILPGPHLDGGSLLDLIDAEAVTFAAGVPTVWARVLEAIADRPGMDMSRLRTLLVGGAAASTALIEAFDALGPSVLHAWGMTETTPLGSVARPGPGLEASDGSRLLAVRSSQGIAAPLVEMRGRAEGAQVDIDWDGETMGELEVRGPWITGAYVDGVGPERFTDDGWFRTGDIVVIDPDGFIRIVDRATDLIKSGGEWISSIALEDALMHHPAVQEAAVIAIPDEVWTERPLAVLVAEPGVDPDEVLDLVRDRFPKWQVPDGVVFVDAIPKTATGKISKRELRRRHVEGGFGAGSGPAGRS